MQRFIALLILVLSPIAFAKGGNVGNGGGGLVCAEAVYLYDLFEATLPGEFAKDPLSVRRTTEPVDAQVRAALSRLSHWASPHLASLVSAAYERALQEVSPVPEGIALAVPSDLNNEFIRKGCTVEGVASYNDSKNRLSIDQGLVSRMSETDQAALWVHESVYKVWREFFHATDSREVRKIVGYLFSTVEVSDYPKLFASNIEFRRFKERHASNLLVNERVADFFFVRLNREACGPMQMKQENLRLFHYEQKPRRIMDAPTLFDAYVANVGEIIRLTPRLKNGPNTLTIVDAYKKPTMCGRYLLEIFDSNLALVDRVDLDQEELPWIYQATVSR